MGQGGATTRYHSLDAMRGVAALAVAAYHFGQATTQYVPLGFLAVDFFFLLSGFVIERAYGQRLRAGLGLGAFLRIRLVRLYPLYLAAVVTGVAVLALRVADNAAAFPTSLALAATANLLLVPLPVDARLFPINPVLWSLAFELVVNLLFAAGLFRLRSLLLFVLVAASGAALCALALGRGDFDMGALWTGVGGGALRTLFSFFLGVLAGRHCGALRRGADWRGTAVVAALGLILAAPQVLPRPLQELVAVFAVFPLVLLAGIRHEMPARWHRAAEFLGLTSFALYAVHYPLVYIAGALVARLHLSAALTLPLFLAAILATAWALDRWYDIPARAALRRMLLSGGMRRNPVG